MTAIKSIMGIILLATTAFSTNVEANNKVGKNVFMLSFNQTMENPEAKAVVDLSNKLYDATEGRYSIEVYPSETLGGQQQSLELVQSGAIQMAIVANPIIESIVPEFSIIGTPYVYDNIDHQEKVFKSGKLNQLFQTTEEHGFTILAAYSLGARNLYGKESLTNPKELKGKKIRVMQSDTMVQMINNMGGVGTPMGQGDVYSAIQSGTLDGAENNIITYVDLIQYEVAPYYSESNHLIVPDELIINNNALNSMSESDRKILKELASESISVMFDHAEDLRDTYYKKATDELGVTITKVDITPFQNNMKPFIEKVANKNNLTKSTYQAILSEK